MSWQPCIYFFLVQRESQRWSRITIMSTDRLRTSPRPHRVVTPTSGVVVPTHWTLGRRGGIQTARQKQNIEKKLDQYRRRQRDARRQALRHTSSKMCVFPPPPVDRIYNYSGVAPESWRRALWTPATAVTLLSAPCNTHFTKCVYKQSCAPLGQGGGVILDDARWIWTRTTVRTIDQKGLTFNNKTLNSTQLNTWKINV